MIKIVHLADVHLDTPFSGLGADERKKRRAELREAFSRVCEICREEGIDVLLISGDLFENDYVTADTPSFVASALAGIPGTRVFISPGNHDPYGARSPYRSATFPDNVHIFTEPKISSVDIPELNTTVYGFGFEEARIKGNPLERFTVKDRSRINLLVAHGELGSANAEYCGISVESVTASYLDYAALGHIHAPSGFKKYGKTVCAYSGCLVGRGFDECGSRGAVIGEITLGGVSLKYRTVSDRRYEAIDVDVTGCISEDEIITKIKRECSEASEHSSVCIRLCGTLSTEIAITEGRLALELPHLYETVLKNDILIIPDISALLTEQSLRGEFCRKLLPHLESEDEYEKRKAAMALKVGLEAMRGK